MVRLNARRAVPCSPAGLVLQARAAHAAMATVKRVLDAAMLLATAQHSRLSLHTPYRHRCFIRTQVARKTCTLR
jgi:hypothetical protein